MCEYIDVCILLNNGPCLVGALLTYIALCVHDDDKKQDLRSKTKNAVVILTFSLL